MDCSPFFCRKAGLSRHTLTYATDYLHYRKNIVYKYSQSVLSQKTRVQLVVQGLTPPVKVGLSTLRLLKNIFYAIPK